MVKVLVISAIIVVGLAYSFWMGPHLKRMAEHYPVEEE